MSDVGRGEQRARPLLLLRSALRATSARGAYPIGSADGPDSVKAPDEISAALSEIPLSGEEAFAIGCQASCKATMTYGFWAPEPWLQELRRLSLDTLVHKEIRALSCHMEGLSGDQWVRYAVVLQPEPCRLTEVIRLIKSKLKQKSATVPGVSGIWLAISSTASPVVSAPFASLVVQRSCQPSCYVPAQSVSPAPLAWTAMCLLNLVLFVKLLEPYEYLKA